MRGQAVSRLRRSPIAGAACRKTCVETVVEGLEDAPHLQRVLKLWERQYSKSSDEQRGFIGVDDRRESRSARYRPGIAARAPSRIVSSPAIASSPHSAVDVEEEWRHRRVVDPARALKEAVAAEGLQSREKRGGLTAISGVSRLAAYFREIRQGVQSPRATRRRFAHSAATPDFGQTSGRADASG